MKNLLIKGNSKMGPSVYIFNIPPNLTCKPTKWCLEGRDGKPSCYARRNNFLLPSVQKTTQERYEASLREDFVDKMLVELQKVKPVYFRWHSSGDFYSEEYIAKVYEIVKNTPDTLFRTTTRRRDFTKSLIELNKLPNMIIRESLDYEIKHPIMGLPFTALSSMDIAKDIFKCSNHCPSCEYHCWNNRCDVCFDEH